MKLIAFLLATSLVAQTNPQVAGHRGCRAKRPENTMVAFQTAIADGVPILETDVVLTKDNHLVLNHDLALNPESCAVPNKLPIRDLTLAQVQAIDCGTKRHPLFPTQLPSPGARIPTLQALLEFTAATNTTLMVETKMGKEDDPDAVSEAINKLLLRHNASHRVILQSFDHRTLAAMKRLNPTVRLCMLNPHAQQPDWVTPAKQLGAHIQFINYRVITKDNVDALHAAGIQVFSGTTDDPQQWQKLIALNVDAILTDNPAALLHFLAHPNMRH